MKKNSSLKKDSSFKEELEKFKKKNKNKVKIKAVTTK